MTQPLPLLDINPSVLLTRCHTVQICWHTLAADKPPLDKVCSSRECLKKLKPQIVSSNLRIFECLMSYGMVRAQELAADPLGILRPSTKLQHTLPLASAYAAVAEAASQRNGDQGLERQRKRMDDQHHEPKCVSVSYLARGDAVSSPRSLGVAALCQ